MSKTFFAVALVLLAGGSWVYLDYLNKKETQAIEEMRSEMQRSHEKAAADMKAMVEMRTQVQSGMVSDLASCNAAAEKASNDYLSAHQKSAHLKPDQIIFAKADLDKAATMLKSEKERCQKLYEFRVNNFVN